MKAILLIDMPDKCENCRFAQVAYDSELFKDGESYCCVEIKSLNEDFKKIGGKPDWCPLIIKNRKNKE